MAPPTRKSISLTTPNQRANCSGFVTASHTRSRGTGKSMVRSIRSERVIGSPLNGARCACVLLNRQLSDCLLRVYQKKPQYATQKLRFFRDIRNKRKIREVVGADLQYQLDPCTRNQE